MHNCFQRSIFWLAALCFAAAGVVHAHDPLQSWTSVSLKTDGIEVETTMAAFAAQSLLENGLRRPPLVYDNFENYQPELEQAAPNLFELTAAGQKLVPIAASVEMTEEYDIIFHVAYPPPGSGPWRVKVNFLDRMPEGFVSSIFVEDNAHKSLAWDDLSVDHTFVDVPSLSGPATSAQPAIAPVANATLAPPNLPKSVTPSWKFIGLGAKNLALGFGHLAFLCGLLVACRKIRPAVAVMACFALGHSISLVLAAVSPVARSSRLVETLVAASVVYVGIENLIRRDAPKGRWGTAFAFGLIHGLMFAQALKAAAGAGVSVSVPAAVSFNLGIELGQIAVAVPFLFVLWKILSSPASARTGSIVVSSVISVLGASWLVQRIFFE